MKRTHRLCSLPALLIIAATVVMTWSVWQAVLLARENQELRDTLAPTRLATRPSSAGAAQGDPAEAAKAQAELEEARKRFHAVDEQAKNLAAELAIAPTDQLKSFGRIEDLAKKGVALVQAMEAMTKGLPTAELEGRRIPVAPENLSDWLMNTEAIGDLEANPEEIAKLYAHALRETHGLDQSLTSQLQKLLNTEFDQLRAQGLDRPHRPTEALEDWYARRDQMLLEAAARIEAHIPTPQRRPHRVAQVMNLGTSFRMQIDKAPDGNPSMTLYYQTPGLPPTRF